MAIVNSYNLFIDTERNLSQDSTGDNIFLPLGQTPITCGSNEFIRLTLQEFNMLRSWNNVNRLNSKFVVADGGGVQTKNIKENNYDSPRTMLNRGFLEPLDEALTALVGGGLTASSTLIGPPATSTASNASNIAEIVTDYGGAHGYTTVLPQLRCYVADGKAYQLLGAKRIVDPADTTTYSWSATLGDENGADPTTKITFRMFYPAQKVTETHVYLRVNEQNTNIATSSLNTINEDTKRTEMTSTKILGIIPIDTEYVRYVAQTDMVFFTNILAKQVAQLQIQITDSNGEQFPLTADNQNTLGNRFFTCVIRVDVVSLGNNPSQSINNPNTDERTAPRFSTGPSTLVGPLQSVGLNGPQSGYYGDGFYNFQGKRIS
tara:strand:+ start:1292 stop:2419 length:1128 start_codon:yes stop_codon:yes gene_type:complete